MPDEQNQPTPSSPAPPGSDAPAAEPPPRAGSAAPKPKSAVVRELAGGLWFPAVFFVGFLLCYMLPFHAPQPHDVRVAVSSPTVAARLDAGLEHQAPGSFDIVAADNAAGVRHRITDRDAVGGYAVDGRKAVLYLAKADGTALETTLTQTFTPIAAKAGLHLETRELVPTARGDATGTGLFYLAMVWNIVPYISVMMLMRAFALSRRAKLLTLAGVGAAITVIGYLAGLAMHVIPNEPLALLYAFMLTQAVAWTVYGLVPFVRQFIPGVAIVLFVLLSIPSSGGAIPYQMVPGLFRALHPVMPLGNMIDALHGIFSFGGRGLLRPTLVLCAWLVVGAALVGLGAYLQHRKEREAAAGDGAEPSAAVDEGAPGGDREPVEDPSFEMPLPHGTAEPGRRAAPMVHGSVVGPDGAVVPGAAVTFLDGHGRQVLRTTTDGGGGYGATGLPEDHLTMVLTAPGRAPAAARILPRSGRVLRQDFTVEHHTAEPEADRAR